MIKEIKFEGLKFKTTFNFRNGKAKDKYFNNLLIESLYKYQEKLKEYFTEKLHILFSYYITFKIAAYVILGISLVFPPFYIKGSIAALIVFIISLLLNRKFKNKILAYDFAIAVSEMTETMEEVREDFIKENKQ